MIFLIIALILFISSLLIFFPLSIILLWKISIVTTEFGHWLVVVPLFIALYCRFQDSISGAATVLSLLTAAILLFPSFFAMTTARSLPRRLEQSFGAIDKQSILSEPFRWSTLWIGPSLPNIEKEKFTYANHGGQELYLNFFRVRSSVPAPCLMIFHSGGWDSGSPDEFEMMSHYLVSRGFAVAAVSYRLAPEWKWPAQKEDAVAALAFIKNHAHALSVDTSKIVLFGRSAGGQIAEAVAYTAHDPSIKGCIAFYAPADLNFAYEHLSAKPDILDSKTLLENYLGGSQKEAPSNYSDASSFDHVSTETPPTLLVHGSRDPLTWYRQSERLSKKLTEHSVPNLYLELPWGTHAFDFSFNGPGGQLSRFAVEWFLKSVVR